MRLTFNPFTPKYPSLIRQLEIAQSQLQNLADTHTVQAANAKAAVTLHEAEADKTGKLARNLAKIFD